jgi:transcriptional regulator with XRE-family HTH domain
VTGQGGAGDTPTLAHRIDQLFRMVHPPQRGEFSHEEVATALREAGGATISAQYIWQLRKGVRDNPTKKHLEALAQFFKVPPAYFFDDDAAARIDSQLGVLAAMRDAQVRSVAVRAAGLSPDSLGAIASVINNARRLEGLKNIPTDQD